MIEIANKEKQLANLEKIIEQNKNTAEKHWFECGKALCKIRDQKLHKQQTFEQYCLQRWGFQRRRAYALCEAYEITQKALEVHRGAQIMPTSDKHARALKDVPVEQHKEVLEEAAKSGKTTEKSVKAAAKKRTKPVETIEKDKTGYPIPMPAMAIWNRRDEVRDKLRPLQELRQWAEDMQGSNDPLFAEVTFSSLKLDIEAVITTLKGAVPYAVCPACQGQAPQTCTFCKSRGMVSRFLYHGIAVPEEMKAMRGKLVASA